MDDSQPNDIKIASQPFEPGTAIKKRKIAQNTLLNNKSKEISGTNVPSAFEEELKKINDSMDVDIKIENTEAVWKRAAAPLLNLKSDKIVFQQIEVDDYFDWNVKEPVIRMYGVTAEGNSVLCHVRGFFPYFYFPAPIGFQRSHLPALQKALIASVGKGDVVHNVEIAMKQSIYGYHGDIKSPYIKVITRDSRDISKCKNAVENGFRIEGLDRPCQSDTTFESNLGYVLRFMIDCKVTGSNWIEIPAGTYELFQNKTSTAQYEIQTKYNQFISHAPEGEWSHMAPLRILSFDIECAGRKGVFPEPSIDPVIQIASIVQNHGQTKPFIRNVFTLNSCAHIVGSQVLSFDDEAELLRKWSEFFLDVDPDVVIGYNTTNFDIPYLLDRAKHLGVNSFPFLGRIKNIRTEAKDSRFSSKAYGTLESKSINMEGRLQLDVLQAIRRDYKLRSYTLNAVSAEFLKEQKEDVHHSIITELQNGNPDTRRRLAVYCLKDAFLPMRLMDKLMLLVNYTEMARVTGVPFNYILVRGQQIKVISQLYRRALEEDLVIPVIKSEITEEQYEGATVIEPERGYYDVPIATLDFTSLYPSIMQAHNLCYTTLLKPDMVRKLNMVKDVDYIITPNNDMFVTVARRKGLLPQILADLLAARKKAKNDLKKETDPFKRAVLDGRQLALKVSANSVYGFTGATIGKLPCLQISSSVTAYGREMILKTKETVEQTFTKANGYEHDAKVIYGDTDSVMIKFGVNNLKEAMRLGREGAELVTKEFIRPINLDFEKVYFPYLLINKKRYAGLYWTREDKFDKLDAKGIETVRRDNCRLVSNVISNCLDKLLIERDVEGAQVYVKQTIADLLQNKVDLSQLVITKALSKTDYENKQAHVELAKRMKERDAGSAPALGDRVAYVIIKASKNTPAYKCSEDPLYVLDNNIPIDTKYYLENQLSKPLLRIFEPILGDKAQTLLKGDHTRTVNIASPTVGGLMKFTVKTATCLGCKSPLPKGDNSATCKRCMDRLPELYQHQVEVVKDLEVKYSRVWTQCQRCQESLHQEVICSNNDCPIFYMRKKVQKDMDEAMEKLERFNYDW
ncbi:DNA polymerase family B-domain-containing protein [Mycotypha africana]|uniref:DNA polymerase family B-domain-containing protein n=1 Tax=Mycotypha africana TaxID=64632 RepID=UPI0022FFC5C7|nr:DNA polymerase family B-domain-containing protein [Mycotypha africana]KAI8977005.1 DNA polymerase family B-domain-containing protein [Mycotypha africana]